MSLNFRYQACLLLSALYCSFTVLSQPVFTCASCFFGVLTIKLGGWYKPGESLRAKPFSSSEDRLHTTVAPQLWIEIASEWQQTVISVYTKTSCPWRRDVNWSGMDMSPVHQVWPKPSCKVRWKGEEDKADSKKGWKTTLGNEQARRTLTPRGLWSTEENAGNCLWSQLWCNKPPNG